MAFLNLCVGSLIGRGTALLLVVLLTGCSSRAPLPVPPDPDAARTALEEFLKAWKSGITPAVWTTRDQVPRVFDGDWQQGTTLLNFVVEPTGDGYGNSWNFHVMLELQPPMGNGRIETVLYLVSAGKTLSIVRE